MVEPVVVIGMHRSGTSIMAMLLDQLGVFMGRSRDQNYESTFFLKINEWLFWQANASWDRPENIQFIDAITSDHVVDVLGYYMSSEYRNDYLPEGEATNNSDIRDLNVPWGWKDPRNTFTIPFWKKLLGDIKVIHVYRNPIDVAKSLSTREMQKEQHTAAIFKQHSVSDIISNNLKFQLSPRVKDINEGIDLWKSYVSAAISNVEDYKDSVMMVKYEDLIEFPEKTLRDVCCFIGIERSDKDLCHIAKLVRKDRKYSFMSDESLVELYKKIKGDRLIKELGYFDIT